MTTLEKVVIDNQNIVAVVSESNDRIVVSESSDRVVVVAGAIGPRGERGINNISDAWDVDKSALVDGSLLIYEEATDTWKATNTLQSQIISAGFF